MSPVTGNISAKSRMGQFFKSNTLKLTLSYLLIIMAMSISFSWVFYQTSAHELGRQTPPKSYYHSAVMLDEDGDRVDFFQERIDEGRIVLRNKLIMLNLLTLIIGAVISYLLARYTLEPIEAAILAQDRFVSDASHELRTPLTAMLTTNEVALRRPKLSTKEAKDIIRSNNEELLKLNSLTDGLLKLAKSDYIPLEINSLKPDTILNEAVKQVTDIAAKKDIAINITSDNSKSLLLADHGTAVQLLVILLDNAIKYSPPKHQIEVASQTKGKEVVISVKDNGPGIAKKDQARIFERFYRVDSSRNKAEYEGYGIGLAIAKQIADSNKAKIEVSSKPGSGSTFSVAFKKAA